MEGFFGLCQMCIVDCVEGGREEGWVYVRAKRRLYIPFVVFFSCCSSRDWVLQALL